MSTISITICNSTHDIHNSEISFQQSLVINSNTPNKHNMSDSVTPETYHKKVYARMYVHECKRKNLQNYMVVLTII
jgi:hypothetical protein